MDVADANICLLARQYSLIDHANALHQVFPKARERGMAFVVGSSLNAGFISGSARFNYGKENYKIPTEALEKRDRLRAVAARYGVDLRTAALQFSIAPDVAVALVVGCSNPQQVLADYTSLKTRIPHAFWSDLRSEGLDRKRGRGTSAGLGPLSRRPVSKASHEFGRRHHPNDRRSMRPTHSRNAGNAGRVRLCDERVHGGSEPALAPGSRYVRSEHAEALGDRDDDLGLRISPRSAKNARETS